MPSRARTIPPASPCAVPFGRRARVGAALALALLAAGCKTGMPDFTASLSAPTAQDAAAARENDLARLGQRYSAKPGDKAASLAYAEALRANRQFSQALAVLQKASVANVGDRQIAAAYGKVLAETGRVKEAGEVLALAHSPDRPDWRVLNTQATVADQLGDHGKARALYDEALKISPGEPSVLANLGLSHVLTRDLASAERYLRQAAESPRADRRVRANLAMVLALAGKSEESRQIAAREDIVLDLGPAPAAAPAAKAATGRTASARTGTTVAAPATAASATSRSARAAVVAPPRPAETRQNDTWRQIREAEARAGAEEPATN